VVIAIAQEDKDLTTHGQMAKSVKPPPRFEIVADLEQITPEHYKRTTAYLIDKNGTVRQVFPMTIRSRPSWYAVLHEIDKLEAK
jgi:hypothetical protein